MRFGATPHLGLPLRCRNSGMSRGEMRTNTGMCQHIGGGSSMRRAESWGVAPNHRADGPDWIPALYLHYTNTIPPMPSMRPCLSALYPCLLTPDNSSQEYLSSVKTWYLAALKGLWRNGSASDSRSDGWAFESLWPHFRETDGFWETHVFFH